MDKLHNGWFSETEDCDGVAFSLGVQEILYQGKSKFQDILVFRSVTYGHVLVLDGKIQCTERDEWAYHEMMANLPLNCHPNPERVLVIGGGDGGLVRELDKHSRVKEIILCEIDEEVIRLSKQFLPTVSCGFNSTKVIVHIADGFDFLKQNVGSFDVIFTDSTDPIGPSESLFQQSYYKLLKTALRPGGIVCSQAESLWLYNSLIKEMHTFCREIFPVVEYAITSVPTYVTGQIGFLLCSMSKETKFCEPLYVLDDDTLENMSLCYYNTNIHKACFQLPQFAHKVLKTVPSINSAPLT